jgi:ribosomal protein S18 acetylase RimI-like enzyme
MVHQASTRAVADVKAVDNLVGGWVALEPVSPTSLSDTMRLDAVRQRTPNLGGASRRRDSEGSFGPAMLIRAKTTGQAIGLIENGEMEGYPGVAVVLIFTDPAVARPGLALEGFALYVANVFERGASLVHLEVLAFNKPVLRMLRSLGLEEQVRLREHIYAGGRFWDVAVFAFDAGQYAQILKRYTRKLPGGDRAPAALGGRRKSVDGV